MGRKTKLRILALLCCAVAGSIFAQQSVTSLSLINADTDLPIAGHDPFTSGTTIDLETLPTRNLNIRANTSPVSVGSVRFGYDGNANYKTESVAPYAFEGDNSGSFNAWTPNVGSHTITATPFTAASGGGTAGTPISINFTVTDSGGGPGDPGGSGAWIESGGMVVIEAEHTDIVSDWITRPKTFLTDPSMAGSLGDGWLEWSGAQYYGNTISDAQANGIITIPVKITTAGDYLFRWRSKQYNVGTFDAGNDTFVKFASGTPVSGYYDFGSFAKSWVQSKTSWSWHTTMEPTSHNHIVNGNVRRTLAAGDHVIKLAARSPGHSIDRIVLHRSNVPFNQTTFEAASESAREGGSLIFDATEDFPNINAGEVPYYVDTQRDALAIDAANPSYRGKFAKATATFSGNSDNYDIEITTLTEEDGECTYRLLINGSLVDIYQNPRVGSAGDSQPNTHTWYDVTINSNDTISIESNTHSNGLIPEGGGFAWARGRWRQIVLSKSTGAPPPSAALNTPSAGLYGETAGTGNYKKWHRVTVAFEGPSTTESATPNPFTDYRLNVTFTHPGTSKSYVVPGYYAADGYAGETGSSAGNIWRVHFSPDELGAWNYSASFRTGANVAVDASPTAGAATGFDGTNGTFNVVASDKAGLDLRGKGRLQYDGTRYLKYAETGEAHIKAGADAPENFLSYSDFDNTYNHGGTSYIKSWGPHKQDWETGDPAWKSGKGKGIIGAINYLAVEGQNVFSFLTYNAGGDSKDVWPHVSHTDHLRFDCSKLDQWEIVFSHGEKKGMFLHFKTQETENDDLNGPGSAYALDSGNVGTQRKLYYRELIARFGHHLALNWNLGEENTQTTVQQQDMAQYFYDNDPYNHHVVLHTYPNQQEQRYRPLLGTNSKLTGASIQINYDQVHKETLQWLAESAAAGTQWVCANDEQGPANYANPPDDGYPGYNGGTTPSQRQMRSYSLWGNLMAGGAGIELYAGYQMPESDLTLQNFRSRDRMWDYNRHALNFFRTHLPYTEMVNANDLVGNSNDDNSKYCFAKAGDVYAIYLSNGGTTTLDLSGMSGPYSVQWYDPRNGGPLQPSGVLSVAGGGVVSLGNPPTNPTQDWVVLVRRVGYGGGLKVLYLYGDVAADGTLPSGAQPPFHQMRLNDTGNLGLSGFKTAVEETGLTIEEAYDQDVELTGEFLSQYNAVMLASNNKTFSADEAAAVFSWVNDGGGIIAWSDSAFGGDFQQVGLGNPVGRDSDNIIMEQFGMFFMRDNGGGVYTIQQYEMPHYINNAETNGTVTGGIEFRGEGVSVVRVSGNAEVLARLQQGGSGGAMRLHDLDTNDPAIGPYNPVTDAALAVAEIGAGRVVGIFDRNAFWNAGAGTDITQVDNREYIKRFTIWAAGAGGVGAGVNVEPTVDAGADIELHYPNFTADLNGMVIDDGRPLGSTLTYVWEQRSGPGTALIANSNAVQTTADLPSDGTYVFRLTADDGELSDYDEVTVVASMVPEIGGLAYAVNSGGTAYTAVDGTVYEADAYFSGGNTYTDSDNSFGNTLDDPLYKNERFGNLSYNFPVAAGTYEVTLHIAENYWTLANKRRMSVEIEGVNKISNLDVFAVAGANNAYDQTFTVDVNDGSLDINFITVLDNAKINAIKVVEVVSVPSTLTLYNQWTTDLGLLGSDADPTADLDNDGFTNLEEFLSGFNPTNASSVFEIDSNQEFIDGGDKIIIRWDSKVNRLYNISQASDLLSGDFSVIQNDIAHPQNSATVDVSEAESAYLRVDVRLK